MCEKLVTDPFYLKSVERRLRAGDLGAPLEAMLWHYAYGKPTEHVSTKETRTVKVLHRFTNAPAAPARPTAVEEAENLLQSSGLLGPGKVESATVLPPD